jgi:hypothetical protein
MFQLISCSEWRLSGRITGERRKRLLATTFDEIIKRLQADSLSVRRFNREFRDDRRGAHRAVVEITLSAATVDLLHNGAGGYRAQYYADPEIGEAANRTVIAALLPRLRSHIEGRNMRGCGWPFVEASLSNRHSKAWIHQGRWLRLRRHADRNLCIARWEANESKAPKPSFKHWARLTPNREHRLLLMGGWLYDNLKSAGSLKPARSRELHRHGFT